MSYLPLYNQVPGLAETVIKANQVIESCENQAHIKGARKFVNQVFKTYSSISGNYRTADPNIFDIYTELLESLKIKENSL